MENTGNSYLLMGAERTAFPLESRVLDLRNSHAYTQIFNALLSKVAKSEERKHAYRNQHEPDGGGACL